MEPSTLLRVLIIEDEPAFRYIMRRHFEKHACEVHEADDAESGLDLARRVGPELVITDMRLPDMSGTDLAEALREETQLQTVSVVIATAGVVDLPENLEGEVMVINKLEFDAARAGELVGYAQRRKARD